MNPRLIKKGVKSVVKMFKNLDIDGVGKTTGKYNKQAKSKPKKQEATRKMFDDNKIKRQDAIDTAVQDAKRQNKAVTKNMAYMKKKGLN